MRKQITFFLAFLGLLALLLYIDWLKGTQYKELHHGLFIHLKNGVLVLGSVSLVYAFMGKSPGHLFLILYGVIWLGFILLQKGTAAFLTLPPGATFHPWVEFYMNATQLLTPIPLLVFWLAYPVVTRATASATPSSK